MTERKIHGGTEMKHFNAVGWSDFVNHVAAGGRQKVINKHRGMHRKRCVQTAALWRKVADAAGAATSFPRSPEKSRFANAALALARLAAKRQETSGLV